MSLIVRIAKKLRRRTRQKGSLRVEINRPGRNFVPVTAEDLWRRKFRFLETKPARAGTKRRIARERAQQRRQRGRKWPLL